MNAKGGRSATDGGARDAAEELAAASGEGPAGTRGTPGPTALGPAARKASTPDDAGAGTAAPGSPLQRLFWFGALWLAGVATVSLVAFLIRSVIL